MKFKGFRRVIAYLYSLIRGKIPTEMTVGDRNYDILGFLRGDETHVVGHIMVTRAKEMNAHLGEDDGQYLLDNQQDIPTSLRGRVAFVFTDWRYHGLSGDVYLIYWNDYHWVCHLCWLVRDWDGYYRVLRRK